MTIAEKVRVHLVMPGDIVEEMNDSVGPRERSRFIAEAVARELKGRRDGSYRADDKGGDKNWGTGAPVRLHAVLPANLLEQIDADAGFGGRSEFVTKAVERVLRRRRLLRALDEIERTGGWVHNPEWATPELTSQWVRTLREESDQRLGDWLAVERDDS